MDQATAKRLEPAVMVAYIRVSTSEQADSGAGLAAQRATVDAEVARRGWTLAEVYEDAGASGKSLTGRPALAEALAALDRGEAAGLIVAKLDRLSRSVADAADLLDRAQRGGWSLVACDLGVDTSTPAGEAMANVMATFAQLERRLIGQRTRDALAARRGQGVRLGRPRMLPLEIVSRIITERCSGEGWTAIGRMLDAEHVPTAQGGAKWYPATVRAVVSAEYREAERDYFATVGGPNALGYSDPSPPSVVQAATDRLRRAEQALTGRRGDA